jgi:hypothetical protein
MSVDILEWFTADHNNPDKLRNALKDVWSNTSVLAALLLTIIFSYGMPVDAEHELMLFPGGRVTVQKYGVEGADISRHLFMMVLCMSLLLYFLSMMSATLHMMYTAALSEEDFCHYLDDNQGAPAEPAILLCTGLIWHGIATMYLFDLSNPGAGRWVVGVVGFIGILKLVTFSRKASSFKPPKEENAGAHEGRKTMKSILSKQRTVLALSQESKRE